MIKLFISNDGHMYTGFPYLPGHTGVVNDRYIKSAAEMRISDILRQSWNSDMFNNSLCTNYRKFKSEKTTFQLELKLQIL